MTETTKQLCKQFFWIQWDFILSALSAIGVFNKIVKKIFKMIKFIIIKQTLGLIVSQAEVLYVVPN